MITVARSCFLLTGRGFDKPVVARIVPFEKMYLGMITSPQKPKQKAAKPT
jgi:hypothetical protein